MAECGNASNAPTPLQLTPAPKLPLIYASFSLSCVGQNVQQLLQMTSEQSAVKDLR